MKVWELIQKLQALPAGSDVYVDVTYDTGHGRFTCPLERVVLQDNKDGIAKTLFLADDDRR